MNKHGIVLSSTTSATSIASEPLDYRPPFTSERLAFLRPRLAQLLAELDLLDAVVEPSREPVFTPRDGYGEGRHAR